MRRAITGAPTVTLIIDVRIGAIGIGRTIIGAIIELARPGMNC
jgi:hypothetical protein